MKRNYTEMQPGQEFRATDGTSVIDREPGLYGRNKPRGTPGQPSGGGGPEPGPITNFSMTGHLPHWASGTFPSLSPPTLEQYPGGQYGMISWSGFTTPDVDVGLWLVTPLGAQELVTHSQVGTGLFSALYYFSDPREAGECTGFAYAFSDGNYGPESDPITVLAGIATYVHTNPAITPTTWQSRADPAHYALAPLPEAPWDILVNGESWVYKVQTDAPAWLFFQGPGLGNLLGGNALHFVPSSDYGTDYGYPLPSDIQVTVTSIDNDIIRLNYAADTQGTSLKEIIAGLPGAPLGNLASWFDDTFFWAFYSGFGLYYVLMQSFWGEGV